MRYLILLLFLSSPFAQADNCVQSITSEINSSEVRDYVNSLKKTVLFSNEETEGSYCWLKNYYSKEMPFKRYGSRALAVLIIVLGALIPVFISFESSIKHHKVWIAIFSLAIVACQGISQTFQFDESWRGYTVAKLRLEGAHRTWQLKMINADSNSKNGRLEAQKYTDVFSDTVSSIVLEETYGFFNTLPSSTKKP